MVQDHGLGGWNCRHSMFPYYEGMGRAYTDEELEELKNYADEGIIEDIKYKAQTKGYQDISLKKDEIIENSFKNTNIKNIALNTKIKNIRIGGKESYHLGGNITLRQDYNNRTVIHEIGHCIDYSNKWLSSSKEFKKAIEDDKKLIQKNKSLYNQTLKNNGQFREFSDIIGGMTDKEIKGRYGHKKEYWRKPNKLERETFAQLFTIAGNDDIKQLQIWQKYLPNTLKEFDNIIRRIL